MPIFQTDYVGLIFFVGTGVKNGLFAASFMHRP